MSIVLAIHAHPDDTEIGCGGALAGHVRRGDEVHLVVVTDGRRTASPTIRAKEQARAARKLGVTHTHLLRLNGGDFRQGPETMAALLNLVRTLNPDIVYTHYPHDTHQEHREVGQAVISAARHKSVKLILLTESVTSLDFAPTWHTCLADDIVAVKLAALAEHGSQLARWRRGELDLSDAVRAMLVFRGSQVGRSYAEAFVLHKGIDDLGPENPEKVEHHGVEHEQAEN